MSQISVSTYGVRNRGFVESSTIFNNKFIKPIGKIEKIIQMSVIKH